MKVKVESGKITVGKHELRDAVRNLKDGYYRLLIKEWDRTLEQNSTLWMWIEDLREHHGYEKQEMYDALIEAYSWTYTYRDLKGKPQQKKVTTSMMSVKEMSAFMDSVIRHAAEESVKLRMPKPKDDE